MREQEVIYEERSQTLGFTNPLSLTSHFYNGHSAALVVCKDSWLVSGWLMKIIQYLFECQSRS